jgi:hypothetical protein
VKDQVKNTDLSKENPEARAEVHVERKRTKIRFWQKWVTRYFTIEAKAELESTGETGREVLEFFLTGLIVMLWLSASIGILVIAGAFAMAWWVAIILEVVAGAAMALLLLLRGHHRKRV